MASWLIGQVLTLHPLVGGGDEPGYRLLEGLGSGSCERNVLR